VSQDTRDHLLGLQNKFPNPDGGKYTLTEIIEYAIRNTLAIRPMKGVK
jgi:hypothetical protein